MRCAQPLKNYSVAAHHYGQYQTTSAVTHWHEIATAEKAKIKFALEQTAAWAVIALRHHLDVWRHFALQVSEHFQVVLHAIHSPFGSLIQLKLSIFRRVRLFFH